MVQRLQRSKEYLKKSFKRKFIFQDTGIFCDEIKMRRALIHVYIDTHFIEMIRVARLLRDSNRYDVIFFLNITMLRLLEI